MHHHALCMYRFTVYNLCAGLTVYPPHLYVSFYHRHQCHPAHSTNFYVCSLLFDFNKIYIFFMVVAGVGNGKLYEWLSLTIPSVTLSPHY